MQGAIYAILIALTGLSGAGLGGAAILGGIKMADKLLLGNKLSSSLWSGFVTGATAYGVGQAKDAFSTTGGGSAGPVGTEPDYVPGGSAGPAGTEPDYVPGGSAGPAGTEPDFAGSGPPMHTVQSGDTLSQIAQTNNTSVEELMKLNPKITNPDVITAGQPIKLPVPGNTLPTYDNGVGTTANTERGIQTGRFTPNPRMQTAGYINNKNKLTNETIQFKAKKIPIKEMIDPQQTLYFRSLQESLGNPATKSYQLTYAGIDLIFENMVRYQKYLAEAPSATASGPDRTNIPDELRPDMPGATGTPAKKGFLGRAWSGIKNAGHQFTTKLTAEKLKMNWHVAGKPTDSDQLKSFLEKQGAPTDVINDIYTQLGLQAAAATAQPAAQPAAAQPAAQPAASGGAHAGNIFANPQQLAASFKAFTDSGATIPMQFRGVLGDILKTALRTVENKQLRMTAIISESRRIEKEMRKLKQR
jgi:LysM repeat protein